MNPVAICCWAVFIVCLISIGMMMYGIANESYFHKYAATGIFCILALLLLIVCLLV